MLKTIRNWLKAKQLKSEQGFEAGYKYGKDSISSWKTTYPENIDFLFCTAYSEIFVNSYKQGIRKALCEYYQEQLKNEK